MPGNMGNKDDDQTFKPVSTRQKSKKDTWVLFRQLSPPLAWPPTWLDLTVWRTLQEPLSLSRETVPSWSRSPGSRCPWSWRRSPSPGPSGIWSPGGREGQELWRSAWRPGWGGWRLWGRPGRRGGRWGRGSRRRRPHSRSRSRLSRTFCPAWRTWWLCRPDWGGSRASALSPSGFHRNTSGEF